MEVEALRPDDGGRPERDGGSSPNRFEMAVAAGRWIKRCGRDLPFELFLDAGVVHAVDEVGTRWVSVYRAKRRRTVALPTGRVNGLWTRTDVRLTALRHAEAVTAGSAGESIEQSEPVWVGRLLANALIAGFQAPALANVLRSGVYFHHGAGEVVVAAGGAAGAIYIVVTGQLKAGETEVDPGGIYGEQQVLARAPFTHDLVMVQAGILLRIDADVLGPLIDTYQVPNTDRDVTVINLDALAADTQVRALASGMIVRLRGGTLDSRRSVAADLLRRGVRVV